MKKGLCLWLCAMLLLSLQGCKDKKTIEDMQTLYEVLNLIDEKNEEGLDTFTDCQDAERLLKEEKLTYTLDSIGGFYIEYIGQLRYQNQAYMPEKINECIKITEEIYLNIDEKTIRNHEKESIKYLYDAYNLFLTWTRDCDDEIIPAMQKIADFFTENASNDVSQKEWLNTSLLMQTETKILNKRLDEAFSFAEANVDKADTETRYLMLFKGYLAKGKGKEAAHQLNALYQTYPHDEIPIVDIWWVLNTIYTYELRGIVTENTIKTFLSHYDRKPNVIIAEFNQQGMDAGLRIGDKIKEFNGVEIYHLYQTSSLTNPNDNDEIKVSRSDKPETITMEITKEMDIGYYYNDTYDGIEHACDDTA